MGFSDLRYGWKQQRFELTDVSIVSRLELQHCDEKGHWTARDPMVFFGLFHDGKTEADQRAAAKEFERVETVRYARPARTLAAKAHSMGFDKICLGVPEDRQSGGSAGSHLDQVDFSIRAVEPEDKRKRGGVVAHMKASEDHGEITFIQLWVADEVFDDIERMASQPNVSLQASVNVRGWHWLGPIGDNEIYIEPEKSEGAELADISLSRTVVAPSAETDADDDLSTPAADPLEDVRRRVTRLMPLVESIKQAAWVTAIAAIATAAFFIFRSWR